MKKNLILIKALYDPHISRIEKILAKFCPKFFDLYASIYGSCFSEQCFAKTIDDSLKSLNWYDFYENNEKNN